MQTRLIILVVAIVVLVACRNESPSKTAAAHAPSVAVNVVPAVSREWPNLYEATGTVRARTAAVLSAKVMSYVREVRVSEGDRVRAGQLLIALDARDLEANRLRAEAGLEEARAALPEAENVIAAAKAQLELARLTHGRMSDMFEKKSISNQEYDESVARLGSALANYEVALSKSRQVKARIAQAEQAFSEAVVARSYSQITAPFDGVVTQRSVDPGSLATPGAPLLIVEREGAFRLEVQVEESLLGSIWPGLPVKVALDALEQPVAARVSEIVPAVDPDSRSYTVKISLPPSPLVRSGMFGRAAFPRGSRRVLTVPAGAIIQRGQLQSVMVADNGVARMRLVTTGQLRDSQVEVFSGLTEGETLIYPVPVGLTDGTLVKVRP
jgi:RND family efflux transporter, MFP subunit